MDGDGDPGYQYATWEGYLQTRMTVPSDLQIDLNGYYIPGTRGGWLSIAIHNESDEPLTGSVHLVLTESELYYVAPNGLDWHHHVMRDMIPTEVGTPVTLLSGETTVIAQAFEIDPAWDPAECELVCFVQDDVMQPDSTRIVWQGAKVSIPEITGTSSVPQWHADGEAGRMPIMLRPPSPNPARPATEFSFELLQAGDIDLAIFDIRGRQIATLMEGRYSPGVHSHHWSGGALPAGIYYGRLKFSSGGESYSQTRQLLLTR